MALEAIQRRLNELTNLYNSLVSKTKSISQFTKASVLQDTSELLVETNGVTEKTDVIALREQIQQEITKGSVNLENVDNTSDSDKPISDATAIAITGLQSDLDTKEDNSNKQNDLTSTNPEYYPTVVAVNNGLGSATKPKTPNLNSRTFYSGVLPPLSSNPHIAYPKDKGGIIAIYKPHQDSLNDDEKIELVTRNKGIYLVSFEFLNGDYLRYKVDTSTVEVKDSYYQYLDVEIVEILPELVDGSTNTGSGSNPFKSVTTTFLSPSKKTARYINSLNEIEEAGEYLLYTADNDDLIPTNVYTIANTSVGMDLKDIVNLERSEAERFDVPTKALKVTTTSTDYFKYVDDYYNILNPVLNVTEGLWDLNIQEDTRNASGEIWYSRTYSIYNGSFEYTHSILVIRDFDLFTVNEIPNNTFTELNRDGIVIVRADDKRVKTYSRSLGSGNLFFNTDWVTFQEGVPRKGFLLSEIKTQNNELVGTYVDKGLRNGIVNIDKEFIKNSPLTDIYLGKTNSSIFGSYSLIVRTIDFEEAEWVEDNLLLSFESGFRLNEFSNFENEVIVKVLNSQGITSVNASLGYINDTSLFITDPSGIISQDHPATRYIITIDIQEKKQGTLVGDLPNASTTYHVGNNVLLSDPAQNGHDLFMEGIFNAAHPTHKFSHFKGNFNNADMSTEAKRVGAQLVYRAVGSQSLDSRFFNADIPYISAHYDNDDAQDDAINDDSRQFYENAILVRGGVLGENAATATSSYGKGVEFVEPSRFDDVEPALRDRIVANIAGSGQSLGNSEHSQSPATAIFAGKFKRILDETRVNWKIARKAARLSATKLSSEWNEFDGFGILDVDACIALIEQWKLDGLTKQIADTTEKRLHVPEMLNYEDLYENTAVSKRLLEDRVSVYDEEEVYLTLQNGFVDFSVDYKKPKATRQGNLIKLSGAIKTPDPITGSSPTVTTLPIGYRPLKASNHIVLNDRVVVELRVLADGRIVLLNRTLSGFAPVPNVVLSLENITFTITD